MRVSVFFTIAVLAICGCKSTSNQGRASDVVPYDPEAKEPTLAGPYDAFRQLLLDTPSCVNGTSVQTGASQSDVNLSQNTDVNKVMTEFSGEVKGTPRISFMTSDTQLGFYRSLMDTSSTVNVVYAAKIILGGSKLTDVTLKDQYKKLAAAAIRQTCGDEYVAQINKGGRLLINITFDFGSSQRRKKWQSLINLNGAWSTISSDLKNKMENIGLEGTMTIHVNQVGGTPNQALLQVKTCALNSVEDFAKCQTQMDSLMDYAANTFPAQVQSNPAILDYQTSQLKILGVNGFTDIDPKILGIRQELALISSDYNHDAEMMQFAADKKLEVDAASQNNLIFNQQTLKDTAALCYDYSMVKGQPDFSRCAAAWANFKSNLKPLIPERITVYDIAVPANSPVGYSLINRNGVKMRIAYAIDQAETWNYGTGVNARFDGISPTDNAMGSTSPTTIVPKEAKGRLLLRNAQGYQGAPASGVADIYPGEALGFVMNDDLHLFLDNRGSISVYWRCVDCQGSLPERLTERILVPATQANGVVFQNHATSGGSFTVNAYGSWRNAPNNLWSDARGNGRAAGSSALLPKANYQMLLMTSDFVTYVPMGASAKFTIAPGQSVYFLANEDKDGFQDNEGVLELIVQCTDCQQ